MTTIQSRVAVALLLIAAASAASGASPRSAVLPEQERRTVETLIEGLESLEEAQFVRNGRTYSPALAGKFLRAKWKDRAAEVRTAEDFIAKVATRSSTTGRPYLIRYSDGSEIPTGAVLRRELERLRVAQ